MDFLKVEIDNLKKDIKNLSVLVMLNADLNIINSRLIDVLSLTEEQKKQYSNQISDLKKKKKHLVDLIKKQMEI